MRRFLILFAIAAPVAVLLAADSPAVGTWKIEGDVVGNPVKHTCTFKQEGTKLTGTCDEGEKALTVTGEVDGQKVTFSHGGEYEGTKLTVVYAGTIGSDGVLKGTINVQPYDANGDFTAKKSE